MEKPQLGCRGAEAVLNLQPNSSIAIACHPHYGSHNDLILLQLDEKLLTDILYERVTFRGQQDEDAVLCSESKTYAVKFVGTSNSAFLYPHRINLRCVKIHKIVMGKFVTSKFLLLSLKVAPANMEVIEVAPGLDKLKLLLSENPYSTNEVFETDCLENMEKSNARLYKWEDLVDWMQASNDELGVGLLALSAVENDGYWRIVDTKCMDTILRMLLHNSVLNEWSLDALNEDDVVAVLVSDGFPHKLALHCLHVYGNKVEGGMGMSCLWRLDERRVCNCAYILQDKSWKMGGGRWRVLWRNGCRKFQRGCRQVLIC